MHHLLNLPPELHLLITTFLPIPDLLKLRITCAYLWDLIRISHAQLLLAESTEWARNLNLYACRYCLRLRVADKFADRMVRRRRGRSGWDNGKRFCVECGLQPRNGQARYGPGAQVVLQGKLFVICRSCRVFRVGASDIGGRHTSLCDSCWEGATSAASAASASASTKR